MRAQLACRKRGLDIKEHRAREIAPEDFAKFDLILVMDWENLTDLQHRSPPQFKHKIHLLMRYANDYDAAVVRIRTTASTRASIRCSTTAPTPAAACSRRSSARPA